MLTALFCTRDCNVSQPISTFNGLSKNDQQCSTMDHPPNSSALEAATTVLIEVVVASGVN